MNPLTLQPAFTLELPVHPDLLMPRIRAVIRTVQIPHRAQSAGCCVDVAVAAGEQKFWSPHLNVQVSDENGRSELYCRYSPRPEVWTMFMALYFMATFACLAAAIYGYVQWFLGDPPWSLAIIPVALLAMLLLHAASLVGQGLSAHQMEGLRQSLDRILEQAVADTKQESGEPAEMGEHEKLGA